MTQKSRRPWQKRSVYIHDSSSFSSTAFKGYPDGSVGKRICLQFRGLQFNSWVRKICWRRDRQPTPVFLRFPCGSADKESACNVEDLGSIPGLERSPEIRERLQTLVFWPRKFHGLYSPGGSKESTCAVLK